MSEEEKTNLYIKQLEQTVANQAIFIAKIETDFKILEVEKKDVK